MASLLEQWDDYTSDAQAKWSETKQHLNDIINDSQASQADKDKALSDYMTQEYYINWLVSTNDEIQRTGVVPDELSIDSISGCKFGIWKDENGDIKTGYMVPLPNLGYNVQNGQLIAYSVEGTATNPMSYTIPVAYLDGVEISYRVVFNYSGTLPSDAGIYGFMWHESNTNWWGMYIATANYGIYNCPVYFGSDDSYATEYESTQSAWNSGVQFHTVDLTNPTDIVPQHTSFSNMCQWGDYRTYIPFSSVDMCLFGSRGTSDFEGGDVDPEAPWDFFNDDINPTLDPDNSIYPNGYTPTSPDTPPEEPENLPHDDGEVPQDQITRTLSVPAGFITQYALTSAEVSTVGSNLWTSWNDPNQSINNDFFKSYSQDFGTLSLNAVMDFIVSLKVFPFEIPLDILLPANAGVRMGTGHTDFLGSGASYVKTQITCLYAGSCKIYPQVPYQDFRDINNCTVTAFLPYCGEVELNPAEVYNRTVYFYYYIDFQSGSCTAVVRLKGDKDNYNVASKTGQIGFTLPLTATNAGQLAATFSQDSINAANTVAGGIFSLAHEITNLVSTLTSGKSEGEKKKPKWAGVVSSALDMGESIHDMGVDLKEQKLNKLSRSGIDIPYLSGGGNAESMLFADRPYVQIRRGLYAKPKNFPHSVAHLNGSSGKIEDYKGTFGNYPNENGKGLCKFTGVDTTGLKCHDDERSEILALLESGVYL